MVQTTEDRVVHVTAPHGEHNVARVEDKATDTLRRIYCVTDSTGQRIAFTGWELESLAHWWREEKLRMGTDEDPS